MTLRSLVGIDRAAENEKSVVEKFRRQIDGHRAKQHQILVPARVCQRRAPPGRKRRKNAVKQRHLDHRHRHIVGRFERELAVEREIPQHRQRESDEIARRIRPGGDLVQQCEGQRLDDTGGNRKYDEFCGLSQVLPAGKFLPPVRTGPAIVILRHFLCVSFVSSFKCYEQLSHIFSFCQPLTAAFDNVRALAALPGNARIMV